eukprot:TRINITY_DN2908_c0_g1_i5.p1 TRINITY_DN2908_c0_g1~~TRINITY_DN2908_c0_g1_i5.p1  ORF type:complete len:161 (-),score=33.46 TRINITY_DN2908_c0_g1_i5:124-606(-)
MIALQPFKKTEDDTKYVQVCCFKVPTQWIFWSIYALDLYALVFGLLVGGEDVNYNQAVSLIILGGIVYTVLAIAIINDDKLTFFLYIYWAIRLPIGIYSFIYGFLVLIVSIYFTFLLAIGIVFTGLGLLVFFTSNLWWRAIKSLKPKQKVATIGIPMITA